MDATIQSLVVWPIVSACAAYAGWALTPTSLRRRAAIALLSLPLPGAVALRLQRRLRPVSGGCACDACGHRTPPGAAVAPIVIHPPARRARHTRAQRSARDATGS